MVVAKPELASEEALLGRMVKAPPPEHFDGLVGGETIATAGLLATEKALQRAVIKWSIVGIVGKSGLGKTFAIRSILGKMDAVDAYWIQFGTRPTLREIARAIYLGVFGIEPTGMTRVEMTDEIIAEFSDRTRIRAIILVIDEAQWLSKDGLELLRSIHDHIGTGFALVFAGGDDCWDVIRSAPMVHSRINRPIQFLPMDNVSVIRSMPIYHRIYRDCDPDILKLINDHYARGSFRDWASFTSTASELMPQHSIEVLNEKFVREVITVLTGGLPR